MASVSWKYICIKHVKIGAYKHEVFDASKL